MSETVKNVTMIMLLSLLLSTVVVAVPAAGMLPVGAATTTVLMIGRLDSAWFVCVLLS